MGFCMCGPNNLEVGQECRECGYVIPDKKYEREHFWPVCIGSIGVAIIAFFFLVLPFAEWVAKEKGHDMFWSVFLFGVLWCLALAIKGVDIAGPYYDGIAIWEKPQPGDGVEVDCP